MSWDDYVRAGTAALTGGGTAALRAAGIPSITVSHNSIEPHQWDSFITDRAKFVDAATAGGRGKPPRIPPKSPAPAPDRWPDDLPQMSQSTLNHILYGFPRGNGNGHLWGYSRSERLAFPSHWTADDIHDHAVTTLRQGTKSVMKDGTLEFRLAFDDVTVGVRVTSDGKRVKTAYPILANRIRS